VQSFVSYPNNMMKVAVCIFGEIRADPVTWQKIKDLIISPNNADVFMHNVYYGDNFVDECSFDDTEKVYYREYYADKVIHAFPPKELLDIFKPRLYLLESRPHYNFTQYETSIIPKFSRITTVPGSGNSRMDYHAIMSQNESRKRVLNLKCIVEKEMDFKYDVVILTRLDANVRTTLQLSSPPTTVLANHMHGADKIKEQMIIGPSTQMDVLQDLYGEAHTLYADLCNDNISIMNNEYFVAQFFKRKGITICHYDMPLDFHTNGHGLKRASN
jgi:hypothetical protein